MASIALLSFLGGLAEGASERIKKEREDNEALIDSRLKMAATNKLVRDKEVEAQKKLLTERLGVVTNYAPTATYEQQLALVSDPVLHESFKNASETKFKEEGTRLDIDKFLVLNKDKIPKNFTTVQEYINKSLERPAPISEEQMLGLTEGTGFLGARTGPSLKAMEKKAQQYGLTARELLAYEQKQEIPSLSGLATMDVSMLAETKPAETIDAKIQKLAKKVADAQIEFGADSEQVKNLNAQLGVYVAQQQNLTPKQERWAREKDNLKFKILNGTGEEQAAARERLAKMEDLDSKDNSDNNLPNANSTASLLNNAATLATMAKFGPSVKDNLVIVSSVNGDTLRYTGNDEKLRQAIYDYGQGIKLQVAQSYIRDGKAINDNIAAGFAAARLDVDPVTRVVKGQGAAPSTFALEEGSAQSSAEKKARELGLAKPSAAPASAPAPAKPASAAAAAKPPTNANANIANESVIERTQGNIAAITREIDRIKNGDDTEVAKRERLLQLNKELRDEVTALSALKQATPTQAPAVPPGVATKPAMPTSTARPAPAVVSPTIPEGAIKDLQKNKDNPKIIAEFERKYGEGTAARYISRK